MSGSPAYDVGRRKVAVLYAVATPMVVAAGAGNPIATSQRGARDPRPPASTTRSAKCSHDSSSRTPRTRPLSWINSRTLTPSSSLTFGSDIVLRRTTCSMSPRLAQCASNPGLNGDRREPVTLYAFPSGRCQTMSRPTTARVAPSERRSSVKPGYRAESTRCPPWSNPWRWFPWGTDLRGAGRSSMASRSRTVTCSKKSASARAVISPATLPPMTTACRPRVFLTVLISTFLNQPDGLDPCAAASPMRPGPQLRPWSVLLQLHRLLQDAFQPFQSFPNAYLGRPGLGKESCTGRALLAQDATQQVKRTHVF